MKTPTLSYMVAVSAIALLYSTGCTKDSGNDTTPAATTSVKLTANATLGNIITDKDGRSLYFFSRDSANGSACTGGCVATWPVFYTDNFTVGTGLSDTDFAVITRGDGAKQITFKGWPLYYFKNDVNAGDVNGDAFNNFWAVAKADYTVMFANAQLIGHDGAQYTSDGLAGVGISQYITDGAGRTLYMFSKDSTNTNKFTKPDFSNNAVWPIDEVAAIGSIPTVLDKTQFTTITVFGKTQLVFKGHPLYYFGTDNMVRGSTKGVSFPTPGAAIWQVVNNNSIVLH